MTEELKPCPFCGGRDLAVEWIELADRGEKRLEHAVQCRGCGADGPSGRTREEAASLWNTRA